VQAVASKIVQAAKQTVAAARTQIQQRIQQLEADARGEGLGYQITNFLAPFFDKHQLPGSTWTVAWDARGPSPTAQAVATAGRFISIYDLQLSAPWTQPVKVEVLVPHITVHLPRKKAFGGAKPAPVALDKTALIAFERGSGTTTLILRDNPSKPSPGYRFTIEGASVTAIAIDSAHDTSGQDLMLDADDGTRIIQLADAVFAALDGLRAHRQLSDLKIGNQGVGDFPQPRVVIDGILTALTPLARSLKEKSRVPGELVLKRDIGDGRREELFVPRAALAAKFSPLPQEYRRLFEEMGLSREATQPGAPPSTPVIPTAGPNMPTVVVNPNLSRPDTQPDDKTIPAAPKLPPNVPPPKKAS
jgi:hypothetical protein